MKDNSTLLALILTILVWVGFFTPWGKFAPENFIKNTFKIAESLVSGDEQSNFVNNYIIMSGEEFEQIWNNPGKGVSGYQIASYPDGSPLEVKVVTAWLKTFFNTEHEEWKIKALFAIPLLSVFSLFMLVIQKPHRGLMIFLMLSHFLVYIGFRYKLHETYSERLLYHVQLGFGLWLTIYAMLALGVLLAIKVLRNS